ncbi:hypothetical protein ACWS7L_13910 [Exiguobacterium artemiae]
MGPHELIEWIMLSVIVLPIVLLGIKLKSRGRAMMFTLAGLICVAYGVYLIVHPYFVDQKVSYNAKQVELHLEKTYPDERFTLTTVPYWKEGYKHLNPYTIDVVFANEADATYTYSVEDNGTVELSGFPSTPDSLEERLDGLKHMK